MGCSAAPTRTPVLLPGREAQGQLEKDGNTFQIERTGSNGTGPVQISKRDNQAVGQKRQVGTRGAGEGAKGVGLSRPVQVAGGAGILGQVVFGPLVVGQNLIHGTRAVQTTGLVGHARAFFRVRCRLSEFAPICGGTRP